MPSSYKMGFLRTLAGAVAIAWSALAMPQALAAEQHDRTVIGEWRIMSVLDSADVSGLDDDEAQQLVGTVLKISSTNVQIGARVCSAPDFEATSGNRNEYLRRRAHASPEKLNLPDPVTSVHISCAYVYKRGRDQLVLNWQGVLFDAVRQRPKRKS